MVDQISARHPSPLPLKTLCEQLWQLERDHHLLRLKVKGIHVWQACRMDLYYLLAQTLGILEQPQDVPATTPLHRKALTLASRVKTFKRDPAFFSVPSPTGRDVCVIEHSRTGKYEGLTTDVYTHDLVRGLREAQTNVVCLDPGEKGRHPKAKADYRYHLDLMYTYAELAGSLAAFGSRTPPELARIESYVNDQFATHLNLSAFFKRRIAKFRALEKLYLRLFKRFKPEKLYVVVCYLHTPAISAARKLGIEVIEVQHGTFSKYHLGYSFPCDASELRYFPDQFLAWSAFWKERFEKLKSPAAAQVHGFPFLYDRLQKYAGTPKDPNKIVVISQGAIGRRLAAEILNAIEELKAFDIHYKLHPGEYERWRQYPELVALSRYPNVRIVDACDLYELLGTARYLIGVFSTAIYEGLEIGVRPVLVDLPGIEYMEDLLASGRAVRFDEFVSSAEKYLLAQASPG